MTNLRPLFKPHALEAAAAAMERLMPPKQPPGPEENWEYVKLRQKLHMALKARKAAELVEYEATQAKLLALRLETELRVDMELLEERLGIPGRDGE